MGLPWNATLGMNRQRPHWSRAGGNSLEGERGPAPVRASQGNEKLRGAEGISGRSKSIPWGCSKGQKPPGGLISAVQCLLQPGTLLPWNLLLLCSCGLAKIPISSSARLGCGSVRDRRRGTVQLEPPITCQDVGNALARGQRNTSSPTPWALSLPHSIPALSCPTSALPISAPRSNHGPAGPRAARGAQPLLQQGKGDCHHLAATNAPEWLFGVTR